MKPKLVHTHEQSRQRVNRVLADVRKERPSQVVVWYATADGVTGVRISEGTERIKTVGALNVMAYDVWNT